MKKRESKRNSKEISLIKFLNVYLNYCQEDVLYLTHDNIKEKFPFLKRSTFDKIINDPSLIENGEIILVRDFNNKLVPYERPKEIIKEIIEKNLEIKDITVTNITTNDEENKINNDITNKNNKKLYNTSIETKDKEELPCPVDEMSIHQLIEWSKKNISLRDLRLIKNEIKRRKSTDIRMNCEHAYQEEIRRKYSNECGLSYKEGRGKKRK